MKNKIKRTMRRAQALIRNASASSNIGSMLYFSSLDRALGREARAVALGQQRYERDHNDMVQSYYLLRRNIHRLEKALIMRPRRPSFAAEYIGETVGIYARAITSWNEQGGPSSDEAIWARDVLTTYFDTVRTDNPKILDAKTSFIELPRPQGGSSEMPCVPYERGDPDENSLKYEPFIDLCVRRRSVRWFLNRPVDRADIEKALYAARQAPSACNRQPFVFRIFDEPQLASRVTAIPMGTKGFSHQVPAVAVVVGRLRAYPYARDRHAIYIDSSLAAMSFVFALEALGLSSCVINWPDQEPHESNIREALQLDGDERVIMLIAFGHADRNGMIPYSAKKSIDELAVYNEIAPDEQASTNTSPARRT